MSVRIVPSILSADFARLGEQIATVVAGGADWIHIDVMDGRFVPNITYGAKVIETVRKLTTLPLDVHLMVVEPEKFFDDFASAGANGMTVHTEVSPHLHRQLDRIRELGCRAGAAINPSTPLSAVREVIPELDLLLVMTVNPGWGGQPFVEGSMERIAAARAIRSETGTKFLIEVDGGIYPRNAREVADAGADVLVAGTAVFKDPDYAAAIRGLRGETTAATPALAG